MTIRERIDEINSFFINQRKRFSLFEYEIDTLKHTYTLIE